MYDSVEVDTRVMQCRPEITKADVCDAWANAIVVIERITDSFPDVILVAVGSDSNGRLIEMVGATLPDDTVHVFHAMTPPSCENASRNRLGKVK